MSRPTYRERCALSYDDSYVPDYWDDYWPQTPKPDHGGLRVKEAPLNAWCGPAALSAALDIPYDTAVKAVKVANLRQYLKAVTYSEMHAALHQLQVRFNAVTWRDRTVGEYLEGRNPDITRIICVPVHWIVTRGNHWCCSQNRDGRTMDRFPYRDARALHVITLTESGPVHRE